jgi:hypothetical protein
MKNLPCAPARKADSFDLPCTTLPHFRIDAHNPAPRITFRKQNVCAAAFQRRAPSQLNPVCWDGVASQETRLRSFFMLRRFAPALTSGTPADLGHCLKTSPTRSQKLLRSPDKSFNAVVLIAAKIAPVRFGVRALVHSGWKQSDRTRAGSSTGSPGPEVFRLRSSSSPLASLS